MGAGVTLCLTYTSTKFQVCIEEYSKVCLSVHSCCKFVLKEYWLLVVLLYWSYSRPSSTAGFAAGISRLYELCVTALFSSLPLYLTDSETAWHFCRCIIQRGTNYTGSWYKEISSLPLLFLLFCQQRISRYWAKYHTARSKLRHRLISSLWLRVEWSCFQGYQLLRYRWIKYSLFSPCTCADWKKLNTVIVSHFHCRLYHPLFKTFSLQTRPLWTFDHGPEGPFLKSLCTPSELTINMQFNLIWVFSHSLFNTFKTQLAFMSITSSNYTLIQHC